MISPVGGSPFIPPAGDASKIDQQLIKQINDKLEKITNLENNIKKDPDNKQLKDSLVSLTGEIHGDVSSAPYGSFADGAAAVQASERMNMQAQGIADQPAEEPISFDTLNSNMDLLKQAMTG